MQDWDKGREENKECKGRVGGRDGGTMVSLAVTGDGVVAFEIRVESGIGVGGCGG